MDSTYINQALIALVVSVIAYFICKYIDNKWAKYSSKRRTKKIIKKRDELGSIDRLMDEDTRNDFVSKINHNMIKTGLFLLCAFYFKYLLNTTDYTSSSLIGENTSKFIDMLIFLVFYVLAVINFLPVASDLNTLRKAKARLRVPKSKLESYDRKKFGITMSEVIELRRENMEN